MQSYKNETNPRPVLVQLKTEEQKLKLLRVAYRLKNAEEPFKKCVITYDRTVQERRSLKLKLEEAREKTAESSGKYIYKVRGPPWDLKLKRFEM
jgi:hypothetical protein